MLKEYLGQRMKMILLSSFNNLNAQIDLQNKAEINALSKFNSGEINDAAFVLDDRNSRDQFLDQLQYNFVYSFNAEVERGWYTRAI